MNKLQSKKLKKLFLRTNVKLEETMSYLEYAQGLQVEDITFYTLPGQSEKIDGIWYYIIEEQGIDDFMNQVLYENLEKTK